MLKCFMNEGSSQGSCIHTCWHVDWHAWGFLSMFIIPMKGFYIYYSRHGCRINSDQFPNRVPKAKASRGVWGHTPTGDFLDFTVNSLSPLSWVSESFRQDIGYISTWKFFYYWKYIYCRNWCGSAPIKHTKHMNEMVLYNHV